VVLAALVTDVAVTFTEQTAELAERFLGKDGLAAVAF